MIQRLLHPLSSPWRHWLAGLAVLCAAGTAWPHGDEDHGASPPAAPPSPPHGLVTSGAGPRLEAQSDLFELVGVVENGAMTIYLDRFETNEPVAGARIEVEIGSAKSLARAHADGTYTVKADPLNGPGDVAMTFVVSAGAESDLLAGSVRVETQEATGDGDGAMPWFGRTTAIVLIVLAACGVAVLVVRRLLRRTP